MTLILKFTRSNMKAKTLNGTLTNATKVVINGKPAIKANVNWFGRGKIMGKLCIAYTALRHNKVYTKSGYWQIQEA